MTRSPSEHELDLRVNELAQLFNSMDPTPFLNKDLDREAEAYIESWAMGLPRDSRLRLSIHLGRLPIEDEPSTLLTEAIHNYFEYKGNLARGELKQLLRDGRTSLLIGLSFVTACLIGAEAIAQAGTHTAFTIARESLTIVGWVAMWRPLQTFLYDWWPLARRIRVYQNLSHAHVRVVQAQ
ncbi:hypothetical protein [Variovorax sp. EBFNA2]|uniref:hypothetical protein n=1 Tax=Variovorax sp. EBFNA2 TaxID=3342097 RepID=UPI0029C04523|nr:hypothetical protein [Variovorax boronicumulans]WPG40881.1 hypothetical protein RZE79_32795 [Variovorax boronicumulans]